MLFEAVMDGRAEPMRKVKTVRPEPLPLPGQHFVQKSLWISRRRSHKGCVLLLF
jgi:hypothetical protein